MMKRIIFIAAAALMLTGCKTKETVVTVIEHRTDTLQITKYERDSIYIHDSTAVEKNDSIIKIERWHTKYVDRAVHDTLYQSTHDTIPQPYPVIKEVPAPLTWWQKTRLHIANILLWLIGLIGLIWLIKIAKKFWI